MMNFTRIVRTATCCTLSILLLLTIIPQFAQAATIVVKLTTDKTSYQQGQIIKANAYAAYSDGKPVLSVKKREISFKDSAGVTVLKTSMSSLGNGYFSYSYTTRSDARIGTWEVKSQIVDSADVKAETKRQIKMTAATTTTPPPVTPPPVTPPPSTTPHAGLTWNGAATCLPCHANQAKAVHGSVHYQWNGASPDISNHPVSGGKNAGAINAYCINTLGNWNGCSACHVGRGAKPTAIADQAQLENIDCLLCHQEKYKRVKVNGVFQPDTANMTVTMNQAVQTLHKPTRATCLQCHAKAGGGDAVKRGDIALAHTATSDRNYDVHMATTGANLTCQGCHVTSDHKIPGRGSDLRPSEGSLEVSCSTSQCHSNKTATSGHATIGINKHLGRLACQTCHIKTYARNAADTVASEATETFRTWQQNRFDAAKNQYHPAATLANDLKPEYFFWNGTSWAYDLNDPAVIDPATGFYKVSRPLGGINDAKSKLYPFKYKTAEQPLATALNKLIALDTSVFFATGNLYNAIQSGLVNMGLPAGEPYSMVTTDEYQTLNHQVTTKDQALTCTSCHGSTAQMDLKGKLGYGLKGPAATVCIQCHENKGSISFEKVHTKHVDDKGYDCSFCHSFSRPERGLKTTR